MKQLVLFSFFIALFTVGCNQKNVKTTPGETEQKVAEVEFVYHVEGMTCDHCEQSIQKGVNELAGITLIEANHEDSTAHVVYDPAQTNANEIIVAIEKRGYHVVE